jgi:hypothetical protein
MTEETMKIELTAEEAQRVINSQRKEIGALKGRLIRAYICTNYLTSEHVVRLTGREIDGAIAHMRGLIDQDQPEGPEDWGFVHQYDHEEIEKRIKEFEDLKKQDQYSPHHGARVAVYSYPFWYVATAYDDQRSRSQVDMFEKLREYLLKDGEPVPPNHFSSNGVWF